jgi:hypothetical protein
METNHIDRTRKLAEETLKQLSVIRPTSARLLDDLLPPARFAPPPDLAAAETRGTPSTTPDLAQPTPPPEISLGRRASGSF